MNQPHQVPVPATGLSQPADPLDPAEALLATVGLTAVLTGNMPLVGVMLQRKSMAITSKLKKQAKDLVAHELPKKLDMPRHIPYKTGLRLFSQPLSEQLIENIIGRFPHTLHDQAIQFISLVSQVHHRLSQLFPTQDYQTALGPIKIEPPSDQTWKFYSQYWISDDPLITFQLMQSGALLPDQVAALQNAYSTLYENMKSSLLDALVQDKGTSDMLKISPSLNRAVTTFLGNKVVPYGSNKHLVTPDMVNPQANQPVTNSTPNSSLESPGQKAASP